MAQAVARSTSSEPVVVARFIIDVEGLEADFPDQGGGLLPKAVRAEDVVATGRYERALEVEVYVDVPDAEQGSFSVLGTGKARVSGHPEITMSVRLVDADGDIAWRDDVRVRSREKVTLDERWLLGFRTEQQVADPNTLPRLTRQALDALVRRQKVS